MPSAADRQLRSVRPRLITVGRVEPHPDLLYQDCTAARYASHPRAARAATAPWNSRLTSQACPTTKMDVTRSVASPSDDIKKAAVFEKDALLSAQTMIYVRGRRPYAVDATPATRHRRDATQFRAGRRRDEEDAAGRRLRALQEGI